ncbi:MAG: hypothetical protein H7Z75_15665 [Ferruginibacter sp.]|nr:hypothetical protein [Cytophagales bacterium]
MQKMPILLGLLLVIPLGAFQSLDQSVPPTPRPRRNFDPNLLTGKTWKVAQLYLDRVRVLDPAVYALRFTFASNGTLITTDGVASEVKSWQSNTGQDQILIGNPGTGATEATYQVVLLEARRLTYRVYQIDGNSGQSMLLEFWLVPN